MLTVALGSFIVKKVTPQVSVDDAIFLGEDTQKSVYSRNGRLAKLVILKTGLLESQPLAGRNRGSTSFQVHTEPYKFVPKYSPGKWSAQACYKQTKSTSADSGQGT